MNFFIVLCCIFLVIYSCVSWLFPTLLAWLFKRKYHIKLKIGRIVVLKLILKDVNLSKDGYSIHINEISFKSSFFNSEINKLVSVIIKDVEITNNVEEKRSVVVETILKPLLSKQNSTTAKYDADGKLLGFNDLLSRNLSELAQKDLLDFRDKKLPPSLIMFAQFMGVHIFNASVVILNGTLENTWMLHTTATEIHADGAAGGPAKALVFSANLVQAKARIIVKDSQKCLGEASCSLLVEGTVKADGPLNVEKIHTSVSNPVVEFQDDLYNFMQKQKKYRKPTRRPQVEAEDHMSTIIPRMSPVIPKIFSLRIDTTAVSCVDNSTKTTFQVSLQSLHINSRFSASSVLLDDSGVEKRGPPQVYVAFQIDQFEVATNADPLLSLNKLKLDAKLEKGVLNLYLILSILNITYNHEEVFKWYSTTLQNMKQSKPMEISESPKKSVPTWLAKVLSVCVVQGCAEVRAATVLLSAGTARAAFGTAGLKLKLDQLLDTREEQYTSLLPRLLLGSRHWSAEVLVDGGWGAGGAGEPPPPPRRHHTRDTALLAVALLKCRSHRSANVKVEAMMDCLRFEWSETLARTIIAFVDCINEYRPPRPSKQIEKEESNEESPFKVSVNVALSHINIFMIVNESICLMMRIDAISIDRSPAKFGAVISGLKVVDMVPYKGPVLCQRTDEIPVAFFHMKLAKIEHIPSNQNESALLDVQFIELVDFEWSANLHLKILTLVREIKGFRQELRMKLDGAMVDDEVEKKKRPPLDWRVSFKNETNLTLILSKENNMVFATDDLTVSYTHGKGPSIFLSSLWLSVSGPRLLQLRGGGAELLEPRAAERLASGCTRHTNATWNVSIESFRLVFPYKHRFADAVQGDFVSLFKWLKLIHGIKKKPFTADSPLPKDLSIKIDELLIEMSDDPFEVKLRDNYELLEDEYKESQKRRTMLDTKVQELCRPHLFLPAGKVEELYQALRQKDAQIYVQRCRAAPPPRTRLIACCLTSERKRERVIPRRPAARTRLIALCLTSYVTCALERERERERYVQRFRAAPPPRTRLIACCLTSFKILALADPSIHGTQNATDKLREIDFDSPWPEEGLEFSTLWFRFINVSAASWQLLLRDFPQPLVSLSQLSLWGTLGAAEEKPRARAVRTVEVSQGAPWGPAALERSMMPLKFYYDLCCQMQEMSYAFGPCWEPVIAQCNLAFDQVSRPSLDPSPPLAWWDKARLILHGRLTANFNKLTCLLHVSLDPYNTTEEMELTWRNLVLDWTNERPAHSSLQQADVSTLLHVSLDPYNTTEEMELTWRDLGLVWTNGKLGFLGELNIFVRTASKYDDCRVLRVPGLKQSVRMMWRCGGGANDHHAPAPCAPTRLPEYSSNQEHDSYRAFRSHGLDLIINMDTKPIERDGPILLLYGSTLRWFESLKLILSGVTRPTKRGRVFNNVRPRKPQLSRHYKAVSVSLTLHNLQVFYWSSSSMQRGLEMLGVRVTCGSKHALSLVGSNDGLVRRARAVWSTVYMNCDLNDAEIWLKAAAAEEKEKDSDADSPLLLPTAMEKWYCVSVRRVSYVREAGAATDAPPTHRLAVHDLRGAWTKLNRDLAFALIDTYIKTQQLKKNLSTKALKEEEKSTTSPKHQREADMVSPPPSAANQSGPGAEGMLAQLLLEAGSEAPVVFSDELSGEGDSQSNASQHLARAALHDENAHTAWLIELVNSQVVLKGCETRGYVILCAARAEVRSFICFIIIMSS
ncbi:hypothetical protein JYU34_007557 [Plutella xylostella]|uniref:FMP27/BLTP2/Hobbit GFWDK motif-containing RBG unit domain-containing protein n=1 Tax=Plutella xylostella TaxID=51655 RepID=A0ABQ7QQR6_PLUXY|nr:hypothetical protein JYU34_007557 [Plutella xylostella]